MTAMIGKPVNRVDGPLKVSGQATYAYEHWENDVGQPLYGFIVGATIGNGRIARIDTTRAERAAGVQLVMTHLNAPVQGIPTPDPSVPLPYWVAKPELSSPDIHHYGQPVALVVATTFEQARAASNLVDVEYTAEPGHYEFAARHDQAYAPKTLVMGIATDTAVGDFDSAFAGAEVKIDQRFTTPYEFSQPMEPNVCLAVPHRDGEELTAYVSTQIVSAARARIAKTLLMDPQRIDIVAPYIGGGFGSKLAVHAETILALLAARQLKQPVKVAMTRQQIFQLVGMRTTSSQRVRLGAERDGRLVALAHEATMYANPQEEWAEPMAAFLRSLYAAPNRLTRHRLVPLDLQGNEDVRAPGEAPGLLALESAMDELAHALAMDPVELRIGNEPTRDPERDVPFSDRRLVECMREGAHRFGWEGRPARPGSRRDARWLVGYGMAAASRGHPQAPTKARVRIGADGNAVVQSDMTDIGTGTYTILTQVAAECLGLPMDRVRVELGRSEFPTSWGSGGSWGAANSSNAVRRACEALCEKQRTADGRIPAEGLEAEGEIVGASDDPNFTNYSMSSYGAHFAEVGVDIDTCEIRLRRMLGVFAAGRILNHKTARSQLIGGMIWGVGAALHEEAVIDSRSGAFVNRDLAEYLVPVHADIPEIDAIVLDGFDDKANALGVKGIGELSICGAGASIANAVFNATGVRVRDFPITLDKVLPGLPLAEV
ncbi:MAG: aldehyde oxidase and xanthine dehydrogenase family protein [Candidatus Eremiobacteraeota bacterium]|nr:aldehyde oxidase and xanthine dehydrogenase family protein [Candidatus Eremiobacteraeota bacterium]